MGKTYRAEDIAELLVEQHYNTGLDFNVYRLHALLYFTQSYYIAKFNRRLFIDNMEGWAYGAVVPDMVQKYSVFGGGRINYTPKKFSTQVTQEDQLIITRVVLSLSRHETFDLIDIIQSQTPWINAHDKLQVRSDGIFPGIVKIEDIKEFFK